jgi:hypothetical protein
MGLYVNALTKKPRNLEAENWHTYIHTYIHTYRNLRACTSGVFFAVTYLLFTGCNLGMHILAIFLCGTQDGDENGYFTMGTKRVYTMYFCILGNLYIISCKCGNKIKNFVLKITEITCHSISD